MRTHTIALYGLGSLSLFACGGGDLLLPGSTAPAELRLVSGDLQQAQTGAKLPDPLVVEAVDAKGRPVAGSRVLFRFEVSAEGGEVSPDTAQTNESGRAAAQVRLGAEPGGHPVEAVVVDGPTGLRVRFLLTAVARTPGGGGGGGEDGGDDGFGGGDDGDGNENGGDGGSGGDGGGSGGGDDNDDEGGRGGDDGDRDDRDDDDGDRDDRDDDDDEGEDRGVDDDDDDDDDDKRDRKGKGGKGKGGD
jgi:hypothetical protein